MYMAQVHITTLCALHVFFSVQVGTDVSSSAAAIPYNTGTHLKYFTKGREVYDEYYPLVLRCSSIWDLRHKPFMWEKVVHFLRTRDSDRCADWWMNYWQGPWTLADCGYAN
jgi:hypothetical protein